MGSVARPSWPPTRCSSAATPPRSTSPSPSRRSLAASACSAHKKSAADGTDNPTSHRYRFSLFKNVIRKAKNKSNNKYKKKKKKKKKKGGFNAGVFFFFFFFFFFPPC